MHESVSVCVSVLWARMCFIGSRSWKAGCVCVCDCLCVLLCVCVCVSVCVCVCVCLHVPNAAQSPEPPQQKRGLTKILKTQHTTSHLIMIDR